MKDIFIYHMRRIDRKINQDEARAILEKGEYGILSLISADNKPYGIPLNYYIRNQNLYFHCALEGKKLTCIQKHPNVQFCVIGKTELMPSKFSTRYESCIVEGIAKQCSSEEKIAALEGLIQKYAPQHINAGKTYIQKELPNTAVYKIEIHSISGKARV